MDNSVDKALVVNCVGKVMVKVKQWLIVDREKEEDGVRRTKRGEGQNERKKKRMSWRRGRSKCFAARMFIF